MDSKSTSASESKGRLFDLQMASPKAILVGTYPTTKEKRQTELQLEELASLGKTYGLEVILSLPSPIRNIDAGTYIGKGKAEEIASLVSEHKADLVVFDDEISPQQQRNLEKQFECVVIDRTELILGVFAQRAHTKEARIQIELASCHYQLPRLRRLWTHLGRQRGGGGGGGGGGYLRGEGETQIEIDRRLLRRRIEKLQKDLADVKKTRETQRRSRKRAGIPTFAIIGYTNAGKSTLLKALTQADVLIEDKLFATLDTTTRKFTLPNHQDILLVDTVGFIRKIPHLLVASFKSTLEEAVQADILLHVVDVSDPSAPLQSQATDQILKELGASKHPMVTLLNKADSCSNKLTMNQMRILYPKTVEISALEQSGFDRLLELMEQEIALLRKRVTLQIPQSEYALVSLLMREGKVLSCEYKENDVLLDVEIPKHLEKKISSFETHASDS